MCKIHIIDSICGSGKTEGMINHINHSPLEEKFLYITPYLSEVQRIIESCPKRDFKEPESYGNKMAGIKYLFEHGKNIVSTHSLFKKFNEDIMELTNLYGYTLIMDEVADVVEVSSITQHDLSTILQSYAYIDKEGRMIWSDDSYTGKLAEYKRICNLGSAYIYGQERKSLIWVFPVNVFQSFKEIYILTYMFSSQIQKYYYDYYKLDYDYYHIEDGKMVYGYEDSESIPFRSIIKICESQTLNQIGAKETALSKSWYTSSKRKHILNILKNNCYNYFRNVTRTSSSHNIWTTFKDFKSDIKGSGYSKGFVPVNARATNEYMDKESVAYLCNIYLNPIIKNFFIIRGVDVDEDRYALSELIQFLFRTRIRTGKEINLYIPSSRMRELLIKWLNNQI